MTTTVICSLANKGECEYEDCMHYHEHYPYYSGTGPSDCTSPTSYCQHKERLVQCVLAIEN